MQIDDETWADIRSAYVDVSVPLADIAARYGLTPQRIGARARKEGWPARTAKKAAPKRPKAAASKKAAPRASGALPTRGAQRALIGRLYRAISLKLEHMEKRMASGEARSAQDEERESRALATLILRRRDVGKFGGFTRDPDGRITSYVPPGSGTPPLHAGMYTGVMLLNPEIQQYFPPEEVFCIIREVVRPLAERNAADNFSECARLLVRVDRLKRDVKMHPVAAGSFRKALESDRFEKRTDEERGLDDLVVAAMVWIEIDEDEIGIVERIDAAHPGVLVDAAEVGEIDQVCAAAAAGWATPSPRCPTARSATSATSTRTCSPSPPRS